MFRQSAIFHVFFSFCRIITLLTVRISYYWRSKLGTIGRIKFFKVIAEGFNGFNKAFSKNLIVFFNLSFTVVFAFSFQSYE